MDEKDDAKLVNMLWETRAYMHKHSIELATLASYLLKGRWIKDINTIVYQSILLLIIISILFCNFMYIKQRNLIITHQKIWIYLR